MSEHTAINISEGESLDEALIELAITMEKLSFIKSHDYSCSGHLSQIGNAGKREGYYAFGDGYFPFGISEINEKSSRFIEELGEFCKNFSTHNLVAKLSLPNEHKDNYSIYLSLIGDDGKALDYYERFVPVDKISQVGESVSSFWNQINKIASQYLSSEDIQKQVNYTGGKVSIIIHGPHVT